MRCSEARWGNEARRVQASNASEQVSRNVYRLGKREGTRPKNTNDNEVLSRWEGGCEEDVGGRIKVRADGLAWYRQ